VSGTITTGNACSLLYWKLTGTTGAVGSQTNITFPVGVVSSNIVGLFGTINNSGTIFPFNHTYAQFAGDNTYNISIFTNTIGVWMQLPSNATHANGVQYTIIIVTSA